MTDADRWRRVEALFAEAAEMDAADRPTFLDAACRTPGGAPDSALREEVEAMLALETHADAFFGDAKARLGAVAGEITDETSAAPERVGVWRLVREIGRGGMGTVHLAHRDDGRFEQTAAVKLVRAGLAPDLVARFRSERQILARLDHPAIARLLDGGVTEDGRPYFVMEYVDGEPITAYCDRRRLGVNERLALFESVCDAVQFAHGRLVVHRDLKPSNVMVTGDAEARVKLLDFGIAKLIENDGAPATRTEQRVMTPEYAAPEQVRGDEVTTATDVYALGVLLYELLTGSRPHAQARGRHAVAQAILETEPAQPSDAVTQSAPTGGRVPPDPEDADVRASARTGDTGTLRSTTAERLRKRLRGDLDRIVMQALRKEPERRYDGAAALAADVRRHLDGMPVEAQPESVRYRVSKFVSRHRDAVALAVVALVAIVGGAGAALWQAAEADRQRAVAEREAATSATVATFMTDLFSESNSDDVRSDTLSARDLLDQGLAQVEALGGSPDVQADLLDVLGGIYNRLGRFDKAGVAYSRIVGIRRAQGDSLGVVVALAALARARRRAPTVENEALSLYRAALAASSGAPDSLRAVLYTGLGESLGSDDFDDAMRALGRAEALVDPRSPPDAPLRQRIRRAQAGRLMWHEDYAEALRLYRVNIRQFRASGSDELLASAINGAAMATKRAGDAAAAIPLYQEALAIMARTDREGHQDYIYTLNNLSVAAVSVGDLETARNALERLLEVETANQEPGHWRIGAAHEEVAALHVKAGRLQQALSHTRQYLAIYEAALTPDHPWSGQAHAEYGVLLLKTGDTARGARELDVAVAALRRALTAGDAISGITKMRLRRVATELDALGLTRRAQPFRDFGAEP